MRIVMGMGAVLLALALTSSARAQIAFGGSSGQTTNQPIDTSASVVPINTIQVYDHSIHLRDFLPIVHFPQSRPVFGKSTFPTEADGTFGMNYLKAFGFQGKSTPHPRTPIIFSLFP